MQTIEHGISKEMQECVDECLNCYSVCVQTVQHCLEVGRTARRAEQHPHA
jgi:hypothetical protein